MHHVKIRFDIYLKLPIALDGAIPVVGKTLLSCSWS